MPLPVVSIETYIVSPAAKASVGTATFLSAPIALPAVTPETAMPAGAGAGDGAGAEVGAWVGAVFGSSFLPQATSARAAETNSVKRTLVLIALIPLVGSAGSLGRDLEFLARIDLVGILEDVLVGLENPRPLVRVAVLALGDLREAVARHHHVDLRGRGTRSALDVREIRHVVAHEFSFRGGGLGGKGEANIRSARRAPDLAQDVVERIAIAVLVEHPGQSTQPAGPPRWASAEQAAKEASEAGARRLRTGALLLRHVARHHHCEHRQHLLQQRRIQPGLRRGISGDRAAHVPGAEDLPQHVVAAAHVRRLRRQHVVEQVAAAQPGQQAAQPFEFRGLRVGLLPEAAENGRRERLGAARGLGLAHAQLACYRLESARLRENVGDLHRLALSSWVHSSYRVSEPADHGWLQNKWLRTPRMFVCQHRSQTGASSPSPICERASRRESRARPSAGSLVSTAVGRPFNTTLGTGIRAW